MTSTRLLAAAAAGALLAIPALAIAQAQTPMSGPGADTTMPMSAPPAGSMSTGAVRPDPVPVDSSQAPPAQVRALEQGDNTTVTNGPVPDTAANRDKYGRPLSHAGKKTPPAGN